MGVPFVVTLGAIVVARARQMSNPRGGTPAFLHMHESISVVISIPPYDHPGVSYFARFL